jgi:hypothetical protein
MVDRHVSVISIVTLGTGEPQVNWSLHAMEGSGTADEQGRGGQARTMDITFTSERNRRVGEQFMS